LGIVLATIEATMRTDDLLRQSQGLAEELQTQQEELQQTNEELEEKARQLTRQKSEVEQKNTEVELAKQELEEKAEQLALTSRYKSQFLANMSHELRTPLNSLLILSRQLGDNVDQNLTQKQIEYAQTIYQSGADLLALIDEILDLAKIESGMMAVEVSDVSFEGPGGYVDRLFRRVAEEKGVEFHIELSDQLPAVIQTDDMRLRQILRNLLSNAVKFTHEGSVTLHVRLAPRGLSSARMASSDRVVEFAVIDTGIGIAAEK
jgi:signal transduction histidine kinase